MKTVGVYTRVSSEEQDAQNQMMAIESYCRAQGWNITAIYTESESAWSSGHQHELARFLEELESGQKHFDIFLIFAPDRLRTRALSERSARLTALRHSVAM